MVKTKHHWFIHPFFKLYTRIKIRRNFHDVVITGHFQDRNLPLVLIINHISWWDGFWAAYLNLKLFRRKTHFMMLETQLRKYGFFQRMGGYPVKKGSHSIIESINYTIMILSDPKNMVMFFPQGRLSSIYEQSLHFEKGLGRILKGLTNPVQVIFIANLVDYFSKEKPSLFIYFEEYQGQDTDIKMIQEAYNFFYSGCIAENIKKAQS